MRRPVRGPPGRPLRWPPVSLRSVYTGPEASPAEPEPRRSRAQPVPDPVPADAQEEAELSPLALLGGRAAVRGRFREDPNKTEFILSPWTPASVCGLLGWSARCGAPPSRLWWTVRSAAPPPSGELGSGGRRGRAPLTASLSPPWSCLTPPPLSSLLRGPGPLWECASKDPFSSPSGLSGFSQGYGGEQQVKDGVRARRRWPGTGCTGPALGSHCIWIY
ncbi:uncharacterized protein LOC141560064 [Sminthopsis crassicaudata]|uniref:uncharacterized protein LOC141560064 n=1 Tax=Sminthopsis crassicaudata TaxID=9301 RepID=UPI003D68BE1E